MDILKCTHRFIDGNSHITKESETSIPEGNWAQDLFPVYGENALWL